MALEVEAGRAPARTDRRKARTRRLLMESAINLLLEKDYVDVMIDEITERADVGRRTFYNHFDNKRDCVIAALRGRFAAYAEDAENDLQDATNRDEALAVAAMACRVFLAIAGDPVTRCLMQHPKVLGEAIAESQRDFLLAHLARGIATGRLQPAVTVESLEPILAFGFVGLVIASIERASQQDDALAWARFVLHNLGLETADIDTLLLEITN